ncbi:TPA: hypothetical protein NJ055_004690 [Vibrio parahaemolyticus]|nr:hypothetical protein [Vibrio parahaemolyticus]
MKSDKEILRDLMKTKNITEKSIQAFFGERLNSIKQAQVKNTHNFEAYDVVVDDRTYLIPLHRMSNTRTNISTRLKLQKKAIPCLLPLPLANFTYIGMGEFQQYLKTFLNSPNPIEAANEWLTSIFTPEIAANIFTQQICRSEFLSEYKGIILEAMLGYFSGYKSITTMSLFPVFEGGLRKLQVKYANGEDGNVKRIKFVDNFEFMIEERAKKALNQYDLSPLDAIHHKDPKTTLFKLIDFHCDLIYSILEFFEKVLYKPSKKGDQGFNRHLILHMLKNDFNESANFVRMIIVMLYIVYLEDIQNNITPFDDVPFDKSLHSLLKAKFENATQINLDVNCMLK